MKSVWCHILGQPMIELGRLEWQASFASQHRRTVVVAFLHIEEVIAFFHRLLCEVHQPCGQPRRLSAVKLRTAALDCTWLQPRRSAQPRTARCLPSSGRPQSPAAAAFRWPLRYPAAGGHRASRGGHRSPARVHRCQCRYREAAGRSLRRRSASAAAHEQNG